MDKELKAKWVAALRSGEYKFGRHQFKTEVPVQKKWWHISWPPTPQYQYQYCALGVIYDIGGYPLHWDLLSEFREVAAFNDSHASNHNEMADYVEAYL